MSQRQEENTSNKGIKIVSDDSELKLRLEKLRKKQGIEKETKITAESSDNKEQKTDAHSSQYKKAIVLVPEKASIKEEICPESSENENNSKYGIYIIVFVVIATAVYMIINKWKNNDAKISSTQEIKTTPLNYQTQNYVAQKPSVSYNKRTPYSKINYNHAESNAGNVQPTLSDKKEKQVPPYPNRDKIKSDLLGNKMPNWTFENLSEFQNLNILSQERIGTKDLYQTVDLNLIDGNNGKQYFSEVVIQYMYNDVGWQFLSIKQASFYEIHLSNSSNLLSDTVRNTFVSPLMASTRSISVAKSPESSITRRSMQIINTPVSGNYRYRTSTKVISIIHGECTVEKNVYFEVDGELKGNVILEENATLVINGIMSGDVYNYGGRIIQNSRIRGKVINH